MLCICIVVLVSVVCCVLLASCWPVPTQMQQWEKFPLLASQFPPTTFQRPWAPVVKCQLSEALPVAHANVKTNTNMTTYDIVKAENEIQIVFSNR